MPKRLLLKDTKQALIVGIPVGLLVMMQCIIAFLDMKSAAVFMIGALYPFI